MASPLTPAQAMAQGHAAVSDLRIEAAADLFQRAFEAFEAEGDGAEGRLARVVHARTRALSGHFTEAEIRLKNVIDDAQGAADSACAGLALMDLGDIAGAQNDWVGARANYDKAGWVFKKSPLGAPGVWFAQVAGLETVLRTEGLLAFVRAFEDAANPLVEEGVAFFRFQALKAIVLAYAGQPGEAASSGLAALRALVAGGQGLVALRLLVSLSDRLWESGHNEVACRFVWEAAVLAGRLGNVRQAVRHWSTLAKVQRQSRDHVSAIESLEHAARLCRSAHALDELEEVLKGLLSVERHLNHPRIVVARLEELARLALKRGGPAARALYLLEALEVAVDGREETRFGLAERLLHVRSVLSVEDMTDVRFLGFLRLLAFSGQFPVAAEWAMVRAERYVTLGDEKAAAFLAADFGQLAGACGHTSAAEVAYSMAIVLAERLSMLEAGEWKARLTDIFYGAQA